MTPVLRQKRCRCCKEPFMPRRMGQKGCSYDCEVAIANQIVKRNQAERVKRERKADRAKLDSFKKIPQLAAEAQREFNKFIRARDRQAGYPCISSGRPLDWSGNGVDAGHYRSVGAASHLRFDERNVHAQSKHDNQFRGGNAVDYRIGLIARIGLAAVEALEADNTPHKWTREELREIKAKYSAMRRELAKKETA